MDALPPLSSNTASSLSMVILDNAGAAIGKRLCRRQNFVRHFSFLRAKRLFHSASLVQLRPGPQAHLDPMDGLLRSQLRAGQGKQGHMEASEVARIPLPQFSVLQYSKRKLAEAHSTFAFPVRMCSTAFASHGTTSYCGNFQDSC